MYIFIYIYTPTWEGIESCAKFFASSQWSVGLNMQEPSSILLKKTFHQTLCHFPYHAGLRKIWDLQLRTCGAWSGVNISWDASPCSLYRWPDPEALSFRCAQSYLTIWCGNLLGTWGLIRNGGAREKNCSVWISICIFIVFRFPLYLQLVYSSIAS